MVIVDLPLGADPAAEAQAMQTALDDALTGLPVDVRRTSIATDSAPAGAASPSLELLADPTLPARAALVSGEWPRAPDEVAVAEPAAARLGLGPGDPLRIGDSEARITGVWRAADATDPAWSGDPAVASGMVDGAVGPVVVLDDSAIAEVPGLTARWTVTPQALGVATATELSDGLARIDAVVQGPAGTSSAGPARVSGGLKATLGGILSAVSGARGALTVPLVALGVIAAVIVGVVVFARGRAREQEVALLVARGARRSRVWARGVAEIAAASAVGALIGAVAGGLVAGAGPAGAAGAGCLLGAVLVGAAVEASTVRRASRGRTGRPRVVAATLLLVLLGLAVAAGLAVAQAIARGGIAVAGAPVDALAAAAPWLVLLTLCVLATQLTGPVASAAERGTRRGRGLATRLGVLQLAHRPHSILAGVLCLALASGVLALAATLAAGASARQEAAIAAVGADVRAELEAERAVDDSHPAPAIAALQDTLREAAPAVTADARVGDVDVRLLATTPDGFTSMEPTGDVAAALAALPAGEPAALTGDLTLDIVGDYTSPAVESSEPRSPTMIVRAWALDAAGVPQRIELGTVPADGETHRLTAPLAGAHSLLAVDVLGRGFAGGRAFVRLATDPAVALDSADEALSSTRALRFPTVAELPGEIPVVVTSELAARVDAPVGGILHLDVRGATAPVAVRVTGVVDALPGVGSGPGAALDLTTLTASLVEHRNAVLSPTTVLVRTDDAEASAAAIREWATHPVRVHIARDAGAAAVAGPALALFAGVALVGTLLGVLGFVVVMAGTARDRRSETVPLRSFGFDLAAQRRARIAETASAAVYALVAGALAGWATGAIIGPLLLPAIVGGAT
ncbi:hypothetical protein AAIB33_17170 [Microbacterium sp. AZCO]|uniref:hypothetical protein n=1 Tax=Microbacterium sp. AZCO TaxID=3142976 RepID=UPI0031F344FF